MTVNTINNHHPLIVEIGLFGLKKTIENTANLAALVFACGKGVAMLFVSAIALPDLVINYYYNANSSLCRVTLLPYKILNMGFDALEDFVIRINQKVLDTLNISVSLPISRLQLKTALQEWENENPLEREIRQRARDRIIYHSNTLTTWEPFRESLVTLRNYDMQSSLSVSVLSFIFTIFIERIWCGIDNSSIDLSELGLRSLPPIFHNKNFSNLHLLKLDNNELTSLPETLFSSLSCRTKLSIRNNHFPEEYLLQLNRRVTAPDYSGPHIDSLEFYVLELERRIRFWNTLRLRPHPS